MRQQELISTPKAAAYLTISSVTLHRAVKRGIISPAMVTPGGNLRFTQEELDRYIRESVAGVRRGAIVAQPLPADLKTPEAAQAD